MADTQNAESGYLPEHAAPTAEQPKDDTSREERETIQLAEKLFAKAKRARATHDLKWMDLWKYFRGDQWKESRPSYRHSEVLNFCQAFLRSTIAIITDPRPTVETVPADPTDFDFAEILRQVIESKWQNENWSLTQSEALLDSGVIGTAVGAVEYHPHLEDFKYRTVDPNHVFPDPSAYDVNDELRSLFFCIAEPMDLEILHRDYPHKKGRIKADLVEVASFTDDAQSFQFKSPVDNRVMVPDAKAYDKGNPDLALKLTVWIKSDTVDTCEKERATDAPQGEAPPVKKYPNGRKIVIAGGCLLEDDENPYEDGKYPYARLVNEVMPRSFWGDSDLVHLKSPQDIINKYVSYLMDHMSLMGNPVWVVSTDSGIDIDNLTNEPGLAVEHYPGSSVKREQGVNPPPYMMQMLQFFIGDVFQKLHGAQDTSQSVSQKAGLSGEAIAQMLEASQTRLRAKQRNLEYYNQNIGQLFVARILQYYNAPKIVRITGRDDAPKYFKFGVTVQPVVGQDGQPEVGPDGHPKTQKVGTYQEFVPGQPAANGQPASPGTWGQPRSIPLKGAIDVKITTGTALPLQKANNDARAERLFDKGVMDAEDFLEALQYPKREKIVEKWKQRQQAMAEAKRQEMIAKQGVPQ